MKTAKHKTWKCSNWILKSEKTTKLCSVSSISCVFYSQLKYLFKITKLRSVFVRNSFLFSKSLSCQRRSFEIKLDSICIQLCELRALEIRAFFRFANVDAQVNWTGLARQIPVFITFTILRCTCVGINKNDILSDIENVTIFSETDSWQIEASRPPKKTRRWNYPTFNAWAMFVRPQCATPILFYEAKEPTKNKLHEAVALINERPQRYQQSLEP